ncbi:DUF2530 domain-containing protein [Cumulibacter manganitolerans]|uniref:DUF2530 domain-containing protein n=1 Tax=Cumulibacter manganitolerans TaxID=1884992 RepID=UPI00129533D6|nr:DUF2530 domain-containing protein [Cumulibacter manganitolerans]
MPKNLRPAPPPEQVDTRRVVTVGTLLFAVAAVVIALVPAWRAADGGRWLWTAVLGAALGVLGHLVMRWQKAP